MCADVVALSRKRMNPFSHCTSCSWSIVRCILSADIVLKVTAGMHTVCICLQSQKFYKSSDDRRLTEHEYFACGALTGGVVSLVEGPVDLVGCSGTRLLCLY